MRALPPCFGDCSTSKPEWNRIGHSGKHQLKEKSNKLNTPVLPPLFKPSSATGELLHRMVLRKHMCWFKIGPQE